MNTSFKVLVLTFLVSSMNVYTMNKDDLLAERKGYNKSILNQDASNSKHLIDLESLK